MKFYSTELKKFYDTEKECADAELEAKAKAEKNRAIAEKKAQELKEENERKAAERKALAAEVEEARKNMVAAQKAYQEKIKAFVDKYHSYHFSTSKLEDVPTLFDLFDRFWF